MPQRWRSIALSLLATSLLFTACKKQSSTDTPLPTNYYPSVIINSDNQVVYAFDPVTGNKNWEFGMYNPTNYLLLSPAVNIYFTPSPLLYNGMVYITYVQRNAGATDTIFKVNSKTGVLVKKIIILRVLISRQPLWQVATLFMSLQTTGTYSLLIRVPALPTGSS